MPAKPNPKRDEIRSMYLAGGSRAVIARALDVTEWVVRHHTSDLPRARPYADPAYLARKGIRLPVGVFGLLTDLTPEQAKKLEDMAIKWQCETLAEAALEILRDGLEEAA